MEEKISRETGKISEVSLDGIEGVRDEIYTEERRVEILRELGFETIAPLYQKTAPHRGWRPGKGKEFLLHYMGEIDEDCTTGGVCIKTKINENGVERVIERGTMTRNYGHADVKGKNYGNWSVHYKQEEMKEERI